ncbi:hypothetical protein [Bradyrhizobium sp. CCBAU 51745]|uniref:hypothetical protein n=1 Tax=Bradyrhizobium sp. CCBAU 51745 TaxID=1325099 RepID=UPI00230690E7|nr:hypothetical protein [Bradyrhizobium sp. CCBAU 51745]
MIRRLFARLSRALTRDVSLQLAAATRALEALSEKVASLAAATNGSADLRREVHQLKMIAGTQAAMTVSQLEKLPALGAAGFRVSSQWGEDGIIEWLVSNLPTLKQSFVEFGVEHYVEANTPFLLQHRNWRGLIADISTEAIEAVRKTDLMWRHDLTAVHLQITRDNINDLFTRYGFDGEIGLLSIDIDGNDYWVWNAITTANPGIVVCEYNGLFGDVYPISVPYDENFYRTEKHYTNLYWGTSIRALEHLANLRGYTFVGSNTEGNNAFFVRNDLAPQIEARIADKRPRPPLFRESRDANGALTYLSGLRRSEAISEMPVVDVVTGELRPLGHYGRGLYSKDWLDRFGN